MGFLNKESLRLIVAAHGNPAPPLYYPVTPPNHGAVSSVPLINHSGPVQRWIFAAKFYNNVPLGWPELQIIRDDHVAFSTRTMQPKPTGHLNVYEYDMSATQFTVQPGDAINVTWHLHYSRM